VTTVDLGARTGGVISQPWRDTSLPAHERAELLLAELLEEKVSQLGHLSRVHGSKPLTPQQGTADVVAQQPVVVAGSRLGIPAIVHEECLTGLPCRATVRLTGPTRVVGADRTLTTPITIERSETMTEDG
jgi:hypothetical protein